MARKKKITAGKVKTELDSCKEPINLKELSARLNVSQRYVLKYLNELLDNGEVVKTYNLFDMREILYHTV